MAGGYGRDMHTTVAVHLRTLHEAASWQAWQAWAARQGRRCGDARMHAMSERPQALPRAHFAHFETITRAGWTTTSTAIVNNVVHYSLFDTAVNRYLIEAGALDIHHGQVIGLVVHTQCHYFESLAFPRPCMPACAWRTRAAAACATRVGLFAGDAPHERGAGPVCARLRGPRTRRPVICRRQLQAALQPLAATP
jgi:acyl-CoA thioester hydrolase